MPVRQVRYGSGHLVGTFPSYKLGNYPVPYESSIERDLLFFLEHDPTVRHYTAQPFVISGITDPEAHAHRYIPDFLVLYNADLSGHVPAPTLIECKPAGRCDSEHTRQQIALGQEWAATHAHTFRLVLDTELRTGATLANLKVLWRYRYQPIPPAAFTTCHQLLAGPVPERPLAVVAAALASDGALFAVRPLLYNLLFHHLLETDLAQPLHDGSLLRLGDGSLAR